MMDELVTTFADAVAQQQAAIRRGDVEASAQCAREYGSAFQALRALGDDGRRALGTLFEDPRWIVRITAAACLLRFDTPRATALLRREAAGRGPAAFHAKQALARWNDGTWNLDPPGDGAIPKRREHDDS